MIQLVSGEFNNAQKYDWSELRLSSPRDKVPKAGPRWLDSGSTGFLVRYMMSDAGLKTYEAYREDLVSGARRINAPLSTMETRTGFEAAGSSPYEYSILAAELIAHHAGNNALMHYYTSLKYGTTWRKEFQNAFGMTVAEFYDLFEEHRAAGFPDPNAPAPKPEATGPKSVDDYIVWKVGDHGVGIQAAVGPHRELSPGPAVANPAHRLTQEVGRAAGGFGTVYGSR